MQIIAAFPLTKALALLLLFISAVTPARLSYRETPEPSCWEQKSPAGEAPTPTIFKACDDAIGAMMTTMQSIQKPILFSRNTGRGFPVPAVWRRGNCRVGIDVNNEDDEETTTFKDIARRAIYINIGCVAPPPHYGGTVFVGTEKVMNVTLSGLRSSHSPSFEVGNTVLDRLIAED